tara:strand:+ start:5413 stop:6672 length:1260 start_codon:yes stop_codon:yes gene_type:complete
MFLRLFFYSILVALIVFGCSFEHKKKEVLNNSTGSNLIPNEYQGLNNIFLGSDSVSIYCSVLLKSNLVYNGDSTDSFFSVGEFVVDDYGRIFIEGHKEIIVFDSTGSFLKKLGREGRGPGEFSNMTSLSPKIRSNKLYTYDDVLGRINIYDIRTLKFSQSFVINRKKINNIEDLAKTHVQGLVGITDSLFLFEFEDIRTDDIEKELFRRYYLLNSDGEVVSKEIFNVQYKNPNNTKAYFFSPQKSFFPLQNGSDRQTKIYFDADNNLYTSWTDNFFIKIFDVQGEYKRSIFYPFENSTLNENDIIETFDYNEKVYQRARKYNFPETWPAIDQFFIDDESRIWVSTIIDDEQNYEWWILKNSGELISKFKWPGERLKRARNFRVQPVVKNGYFYIRESDKETGMKQIVKYKIVFEKKIKC